MNPSEMLQIIISLVHTFIRFLPLSLYSFTYLSIALYKDLRSAVLLLGLILNDIVGMIYNKYRPDPKPAASCAIFQKKEDNTLGFVPNSHVEIVSFVGSVFISDMRSKGKIDIIPFWFLIALLVITIWSRINIGCEDLKMSMFNVIFGAIRGIIFYFFFSKYYKSAEKDALEKETCDLGYKDYKCDTIKNGVVIVKDTNINEKKGSDDNDNDDNDKEDEVFQQYYD